MQKKQFLKDLNLRDPNWMDTMKQRKQLEVQRMEQRQQQINREIEERKKQMDNDIKINQRLNKVKEENEKGLKALEQISQEQRMLKENIR